MERIVLFSGITVLVILGILLGSSCQNSQDEILQVSVVESSSFALCGGTASLPDIDALPQPKLRTGIGNSHLSITSSSSEAQIWFNQGLNLLHGFWHLEAYRAFRQVIQLDPQCAMGYWGIAMCQPGFGGNSKIWLEAIEEAQKQNTATSEPENAFINATAILVKKGIAEALPSFKKIMDNYPDEPEAIAFAALMMRQSAFTQSQNQELKTLLENALRRFPNHSGLQHYYVHLMELRPDFALAKPIASKMIRQASGISHLLHMPGHLYFLEGDYTKAVTAFEQARAAELRYHKEEKIPKATDQNYMHNLHYLAVTYAELNEYENALKAAEEYAHITMKQTTPSSANELILLYEGRILPALVNMRFRKYDEALEQLNFWQNTPDFPISNQSVIKYLRAMEFYCRGMKDILNGKEENAILRSKSLKSCINEFESIAASKKGTSEMFQINKTYDIMMMAWYDLVGWGVNMDTANEFIKEPWEKAFELEKAIGYEEPPRLMCPVAESKALLHKQRNEQLLFTKSIKKAFDKRPKSKIISSI